MAHVQAQSEVIEMRRNMELSERIKLKTRLHLHDVKKIEETCDKLETRILKIGKITTRVILLGGSCAFTVFAVYNFVLPKEISVFGIICSVGAIVSLVGGIDTFVSEVPRFTGRLIKKCAVWMRERKFTELNEESEERLSVISSEIK